MKMFLNSTKGSMDFSVMSLIIAGAISFYSFVTLEKWMLNHPSREAIVNKINNPPSISEKINSSLSNFKNTNTHLAGNKPKKKFKKDEIIDPTQVSVTNSKGDALLQNTPTITHTISRDITQYMDSEEKAKYDLLNNISKENGSAPPKIKLDSEKILDIYYQDK